MNLAHLVGEHQVDNPLRPLLIVTFAVITGLIVYAIVNHHKKEN